jgi:hypothetical protein
MKKRVLYLGDTRLQEAAAYLAGVMSYYGLPYDYHPSDAAFQESWLTDAIGLVVLSDYPAANFTRQQLLHLAAEVKKGLSFLMIGGWESFVGLDGGYQKTIAAEILPVAMQDTDDRMNLYSPCLIKQCHPHPVVQDLPFEQETPAIGGFNQFAAKENTDVILSSVQVKATWQDGSVHFERTVENPLLVLGSYGAGKTAAFATDVAPHWVGPLVDWGDQRLTACAPGSHLIEVGCWYAAFLKNLIGWLTDSNV